jgi:hypothetical protein
VRQRQSRAFVNYNGYNFSGVLLMTGEDAPAQSVQQGFGRQVREVMTKYGISAEFGPRQLIHSAQDLDPLSAEALDDISGNWNI